MGEEWSKDKHYEIMGEPMKNKYMVYFEDWTGVAARDGVFEFLTHVKRLGDVKECHRIRSGNKKNMKYDIGLIVVDDLPEDRRVKLWTAILDFYGVDCVKQPALEMADDTSQVNLMSDDELQKRVDEGYEKGFVRGQLDMLATWRDEVENMICTQLSYAKSRKEVLKDLEKYDDE